MKSFVYPFPPFLVFFCLALLGFPAFVQAQEGIDKSLPPLIMVVFDTSGSMDAKAGNDSTHTRLTIAISELAGTPKRVAKTPLKSLYGAKFMRKVHECTATSCSYEPRLYCVNSGSVTYTKTGCNKLTVNSTSYLVSNLNTSFYDVNKPEEYPNAYFEDGVLQAYQYSVKFGFAGMAYEGYNKNYVYGHKLLDLNGINVGKVITEAYKNGNNGMWHAGIDTLAPLLYPTTSDKQSDIFASNDSVISSIRTYFPSSNTPIGPLLADLFYMFGEKDQSTPDLGLVQQHVENNKSIVVDKDYICRPKAVIFVTDGAPSGPGYKGSDAKQHGHAVNVWHDAYHLYTAGIKTYTVGYAFTGLKGHTGVGKTMNMMAWKGGTCRTQGTYGSIIDPDDKTTYDAFIANKLGNKSNICFFDASDSTALRQALVTVLSDMLSGRVSKTKIATSSAIGMLKNYNGVTKSWRNGWYNVLSGYQVTLGHVRHTTLQRETFVCNNTSGLFENDPDQFLDLSLRLSDRVKACTASGDCLNDRYIFGGDYSTDRYRLAPELVTIANNKLGKINYKNGSISATYNFLDRDETKTGDKSCEAQRLANIDTYNIVSQNYYISPYECAVDLDCGFESNRPRHCLVGKCVNAETISSYASCSAAGSCGSGNMCFAGKCMSRGGSCNRHSDCLAQEVCHVGRCVVGTVKACSTRDFIASAPLGTIEYATPLVVEPPNRGHKSKEYRDFSKKYWLRDSMLYVGANDGLLHAFVLGQNKTDNSYKPFASYSGPSKIVEGDERWGFLPKTILKNLYKLPDFGSQTHVNAAPVSSDVKFPEDGQWHSVLVGGFREGGRGYYALDVSDPSNPSILWEIDQQWQSNLNPKMPDPYENLPVTATADTANDLKTDYPFLRLGLSYAPPVITNVIIGDKVEPVAILSGGEPHIKDVDNLSGRALYVVRLNPKTPEALLVKAFYYDSAITGAPAVYPNNFNSIAKLIYVGDEHGALHRIDISNTDVSQWTQHKNSSGSVIPIFDPNTFTNIAVTGRKYEKITYPPAVSTIRPDGQVSAREDIQLAFGSGSSDNLNIKDTDLNYAAVMIDHYDPETGKYQLNPYPCDREKAALNSCAFASQIILFNTKDTSLTTKENVVLSLEDYDKQYYSVYTVDPMTNKAFSERQKMSGPALTYNFQNYFPTFVAAKADANCAYGNAAIWRLGGAQNSKTHQKLVQTRVQNKATEDDAFDDKSYFELASNTTVYGLELSKQTFCLMGDANTATTGFAAAPQLIAQTGAETSGFKSKDTNDESEKLKSATTDIKTIALNLEAIQPETRVISWASVYE